MTFAAPLFLLAALAAAIPVILHMINRRRAKDLPFSTLRFLKVSVQKTRRRKRIHDLLLMLLRAAVLLLIAAGLAKPTVTRLSTLWGGGHSAVAIVLDNSASMGRIDQERMRFETAQAAAMDILDEFKEGDQVAMFLSCGPTFPEFGTLRRTQEEIRQLLPQCHVGYERAELLGLVQQARQLLARSEGDNKCVYVITDGQKVSWEELEEEERGVRGEETKKKPPENEEAAKIPVVIVDCNRNPKPNVAVQGVDVEAAAPVAGSPVQAAVQLLNPSTVPQSVVLELYVDGRKEQSSPALNLPPGEGRSHVFSFAFRRGGLHRCEVRRAGADGSKFDDRRFFAMTVGQGVPVAIVKQQRHEIPYLDDAYYLEKALAPEQSGGWVLQTTTLTAAELISEPLSRYRVIFCVNLSAPGSDAAERLRAYVAAGGNLVWIAGENVDVEAYNQMNEQAQGQLLPSPLADVRSPSPQDQRDAWHINFLDPTFPGFRPLREPAILYESVLVYKQVRMAAPEGDPPRVLVRVDDGEPLLALQKVEAGQVLFWGTSVHVGWTNFPLRRIFLPLMARLTFELAGMDQVPRQVLAGQPLVLHLEQATAPLGVEIVLPSGETIRRKTRTEKGPSGQRFRYADTHAIGIYILRILEGAKAAPIAYSVNIDPDEADPQTIDRGQLQKRLGGAPVIFAANPEDLSVTFALLREGKSLWGLFLAGVLLVLVFETFLSNRLSPRKEEPPPGPLPPPGMRRKAFAPAQK